MAGASNTFTAPAIGGVARYQFNATLSLSTTAAIGETIAVDAWFIKNEAIAGGIQYGTQRNFLNVTIISGEIDLNFGTTSAVTLSAVIDLVPGDTVSVQVSSSSTNPITIEGATIGASYGMFSGALLYSL